MNPGTPAPLSALLASSKETVFEAIAPAAYPGSAADSGPELRHRRILELREAIESGEYCVPASGLADALLGAVRRAN